MIATVPAGCRAPGDGAESISARPDPGASGAGSRVSQRTDLDVFGPWSTQPREQGSIRWTERRSAGLTAKHGTSLAEHDNLDHQIIPVSPALAYQFENLGEGKVEK